jgi:pimeloyl-ACP methyl ester carboxylesterase
MLAELAKSAHVIRRFSAPRPYWPQRLGRDMPLAGVSCPVWIAVGDYDLWVDPERAAWTAAQIPVAEFQLLEGVEHYPMEVISDFGLVLDGWLKKLMSMGAPP